MAGRLKPRALVQGPPPPRRVVKDDPRTLHEAIRKNLEENVYPGCEIEVPLAGWECVNSPTGFCIYNITEDPCMDSCIICGDPEERK